MSRPALAYVFTEMHRDPATNARTRVWIPIGAVLFLVALTVSALIVPQLRLLHLLQALIYGAVVILARRNSAWGIGAGFTVSVAWNSLNLFVTHLMQAGAVAFSSFLRTGQMRRLDTMLVPLGGIGHFILIVACLAALLDLRTDNPEVAKVRFWRRGGSRICHPDRGHCQAALGLSGSDWRLARTVRPKSDAKTVMVACRDGDVLQGIAVFVSDAEHDVIFELESSNNPTKYP